MDPNYSYEMANDYHRDSHCREKRPRSFACSVCGKAYTVWRSLWRHEKFECVNARPAISCDLCPYKSPHKWCVQNHKKKHHGEDARSHYAAMWIFNQLSFDCFLHTSITSQCKWNHPALILTVLKNRRVSHHSFNFFRPTKPKIRTILLYYLFAFSNYVFECRKNVLQNLPLMWTNFCWTQTWHFYPRNKWTNHVNVKY